ncbi:hypothetical protein ACR03S_07945 [Limimaricola variabilis]
MKDIAARIGAIAQANWHIQHSLSGLARHGDLALFLEVLSREFFPLYPQGGLIEADFHRSSGPGIDWLRSAIWSRNWR